jgi:hypothetical protein
VKTASASAPHLTRLRADPIRRCSWKEKPEALFRTRKMSFELGIWIFVEDVWNMSI